MRSVFSCIAVQGEAAPILEKLNAACPRLSRRHFSVFASRPAGSPSLAVTALCSGAPLSRNPAVDGGGGGAGGLCSWDVPVALSVSCGQCGLVIWEALREYVLVSGQQSHIHSELWSNTPPKMVGVRAVSVFPVLKDSGGRVKRGVCVVVVQASLRAHPDEAAEEPRRFMCANRWLQISTCLQSYTRGVSARDDCICD